MDLTSLKSVRQFAHAFRSRGLSLHVLVNNGMLPSYLPDIYSLSKRSSVLPRTAGTMLVPERQTEDGFEFHFCLNYLGHFLLTNLLLDILKKSGKHGQCSRIVNMSSATHYSGIMLMNDLNRRYNLQWEEQLVR